MIKKNYVDIDIKKDKAVDECGVFGIYRNDEDINSVEIVTDALYGLQHRGQESGNNREYRRRNGDC